MTTKLKFPYTMHCPKCKTPLKIKSPAMVGKRIDCPKCKKRIDVVTPDEDAVVAYGVEAAPEKEKPPEPTEEEILEKEIATKRKKRSQILYQVWFWISALVLLSMIGAGGYIVYNFAWLPYINSEPAPGEKEEFVRPKEFSA